MKRMMVLILFFLSGCNSEWIFNICRTDRPKAETQCPCCKETIEEKINAKQEQSPGQDDGRSLPRNRDQ